MSQFVDLDAVPDAMRSRDQWLHWDAGNDTPRRPHRDGEFAVSWSDPDAWLSFADATEATLPHDSWGIGYVTAVNNDAHAMGMVSVIDLDNAVTADGEIANWVPDLQPLLDRECYIEWSPSHHEPGPSGLHIPVVGTDIPAWWSDSQIDDHTARHLFDQGSRGSSKYDDDAEELIDDITSRTGSGVTIGTLVHRAQEGGWEPEPPGGHSRTRTPRELVAEYSDEYDSVDDVPADLFDSGADDAAATDGGATAADSDDSDTASPDEPSTETGWRDIRTALRAADSADERDQPRFHAAMKLLDDYHFRTLAENDVLYVYDDDTGVYDDTGEAVVRSQLTTGLEDQYSAHTMAEAHDHIRGRTLTADDEMGGPAGFVAAENCVIDLDDKRRRDHSPEFNFLSRLGCEFDPDATAPRFRAFLNEVVPNDTERRKLQEYAGYTLHHWGLPHHKALFLVGPTASGKSTFLDAINAMLGDDTVASLTPQQLTGERFAGAELHGKWANIRNDIPASTVENTGLFKEVVAGDPMKAERKRKDPFMFEPTAKHLYAANELPATETDDEAFYRRILLVAFPETVPVAERDKRLDEKLEAELPGILNWAIEGLQRLMANGGFTGDRRPGRTQETWQKWSDSVSRFSDAALDEGDEEIPKAKIYAAYIEFCRQEGIPSDTQHSMTRALKQEGFEDARTYVDGERQRVFVNISLTGRGTELLDDAQGGSDDSGTPEGKRRDRGLSGFGE